MSGLPTITATMEITETTTTIAPPIQIYNKAKEETEFNERFGNLKIKNSLLSPRKKQIFDSADYFEQAQKVHKKRNKF